jgi:hypothetical protein
MGQNATARDGKKKIRRQAVLRRAPFWNAEVRGLKSKRPPIGCCEAKLTPEKARAQAVVPQETGFASQLTRLGSRFIVCAPRQKRLHGRDDYACGASKTEFHSSGGP